MMSGFSLCLISMGLFVIGVQDTYANPLDDGSKEYYVSVKE